MIFPQHFSCCHNWSFDGEPESQGSIGCEPGPSGHVPTGGREVEGSGSETSLMGILSWGAGGGIQQ